MQVSAFTRYIIIQSHNSTITLYVYYYYYQLASIYIGLGMSRASLLFYKPCVKQSPRLVWLFYWWVRITAFVCMYIYDLFKPKQKSLYLKDISHRHYLHLDIHSTNFCHIFFSFQSILKLYIIFNISLLILDRMDIVTNISSKYTESHL